MEKTIRIGISACLLGERVRYDGGHKLDEFLKDAFGPSVEWVPVCPEVECGLPVPREAMSLSGPSKTPRLVTTGQGIDHTDRMLQWTKNKLSALAAMGLAGFVFKSRSPSCSLRGVPRYTASGRSGRKGRGLFANAFIQYVPAVPVEDDERLHDPRFIEKFKERVRAHERQRENGAR